jgi:hypothetical protein
MSRRPPVQVLLPKLYARFARWVCRHAGHRYAFEVRSAEQPPAKPWEPIATAYCSRCGVTLDTVYQEAPSVTPVGNMNDLLKGGPG